MSLKLHERMQIVTNARGEFDSAEACLEQARSSKSEAVRVSSGERL